MVSIDNFSKELCGGTHLRDTGEMGLFKIISESSIASGVRRIEAVTGEAGYQRFVHDEQILDTISRNFKVDTNNLPEYIDGLQGDLRTKQKELDRLKLKIASRTLDEIVSRACDLDGITVVSGVVDDVDRSALRNLADQLLNRFEKTIVALGAEIDGKAALVVMVTKEISKEYPAGKIVGSLARLVDGGGGGRPVMAEAGGKNPAKLREAMDSLDQLVSS